MIQPLDLLDGRFERRGGPDSGGPLVDRFRRVHSYLRISLTDRCNFRCVYCMPPEGIAWRERDEILTFEEIIRLSRLFVKLGIDKIRLTGGEPTVRKGLPSLIRELRSIPGLKHLCMTTNGVLLADRAQEYEDAGLDSVTISIDSLQKERFAAIARRDHLESVLRAIDEAERVGFEPIKLNVVLMSSVNEDEVLDFVDFVKDRRLNVRFIEYMPFKGNGWSQAGLVPYAAMRGTVEERYTLDPIATHPSAVAKDFRIRGHQGTVSFITSMTEDFCAGCNRIRLTADGSIKSCLFSQAELNLRDPMRAGLTDEEVEARIRAALWLKPKGHPPMEELMEMDNRTMIEIGG